MEDLLLMARNTNSGIILYFYHSIIHLWVCVRARACVRESVCVCVHYLVSDLVTSHQCKSLSPKLTLTAHWQHTDNAPTTHYPDRSQFQRFSVTRRILEASGNVLVLLIIIILIVLIIQQITERVRYFFDN